MKHGVITLQVGAEYFMFLYICICKYIETDEKKVEFFSVYQRRELDNIVFEIVETLKLYRANRIQK